MKVQTNLKAGNVLQDATGYARQTVNTATGFVNSARQEANAVVDTISSTANTAWNAVTGLFR
jgi:hypothetical protein